MTFWVAGAVVGGQLVSSIVGSNAATSAAQTQADAAKNAQNISQQEFNTITQQEQPFIQGGYGALSQLNYLMGIPSGGYGGAPTYGGAPSASTPQSGYPSMTGGPSFNGGFGFSYAGPGQAPTFGQSPTGGAPTGGAPTTALTPPGYDPSSGYSIGPGGSITRGFAGGSTPAGAPAAAGGSTAGGYGSLLAPFTADTFRQMSPAYNFQLQQGRQGVLNADAAGQGAMSGSAMKDLIDYNQNAANTSFNNAFNQYQTQQGNIYSRLAGLAQLGQAAATNTGQQGTALAGQAAQSATNIGTALGAGQIGSANAITGGIQSAIPWLMGGSGGNYGNGYTTSGGFGLNPSGDAAAIDPSSGTSYAAWSDRRLKTGIEAIGLLPSGLPVYRFKYLWDLATERVGVMADEAQAMYPEAVSSLLGFLRVDYGRVLCQT